MGSVYLRLKERNEGEEVGGTKMENDEDKKGWGQATQFNIFLYTYLYHAVTFYLHIEFDRGRSGVERLSCKPKVGTSILGPSCPYGEVPLGKALNPKMLLVVKLSPRMAAAVISVGIGDCKLDFFFAFHNTTLCDSRSEN